MLPPMEHGLYCRNVFNFGEATVWVRDGRITRIDNGPRSHGGAATVTDLTPRGIQNAILLPGLVDTHVHINEPGRTDWEGFETATQAAAAGGITTVVDMPLNCIPVTTSSEALRQKKEAVTGKLTVDSAFHGGIVPNLCTAAGAAEIVKMIGSGVKAFKAFLIDSGIPEFPAVSADQLDHVMPILADHGIPLLVHAEIDCGAPPAAEDRASYRGYLESRPQRWETEAVRQMIALARKHRCRIHIVHLSASDALPLIEDAKARGIPITAETCPHYLTLFSEEIPDGDARFKCAPPIREQANRERLWEGLRNGVIDFIVSDHSPCTPRLKNLEDRNLRDAWGGIASLQLTLPLIWTEARRLGFDWGDLTRWLCSGPASLVGLKGRKGAIAPGFDADLTLFDPDATTQVSPDQILHRHKLTPYDGRRLEGAVLATWLRGSQVFPLQNRPEGVLL